MATNYPGSLDSFARFTATDQMDDAGFEGDVVIDNLYDAVEAVQAELGTDPAGAQATVKARLGYAESVLGGGGASTFVWRVGDYLSNQTGSSTAQGLTMIADIVYYVPLWVPITRTADRVGVYVSTLAAATNVKIAAYESTTAMVPGTRLASFGSVDSSTTGLKEITISQSFTGSTLYWIALHPSGAPALRAHTPGVAVLGNSTGTAVGGYNFFQEDETYASGPPATATLQYVSNEVRPAVWLRGS